MKKNCQRNIANLEIFVGMEVISICVRRGQCNKKKFLLKTVICNSLKVTTNFYPFRIGKTCLQDFEMQKKFKESIHLSKR